MSHSLRVSIGPAALLGLAISLILPLESALAQLPVARITSIFPPGGKLGTSVDVTVTGTDLDELSTLHFSHPGISAAAKMTTPAGSDKPQPVANQFTVTMKPDVPNGSYEVRAVGKYGISNPRTFIVGDLPEMLENDANNELAQAQEIAIPNIVNGQSNGVADQDHFKFTAKKGQRILAECFGQRIDSRLDATLVLYNAQGQEIDRDRDTNRRDPLIDFIAPEDGVYTVKIFDLLYQGGNEYFYRLSLSSSPYIDFILPAAGVPGAKGQFTIYGRNLPGGSPAELPGLDGKPARVLIGGKPLEKLAVEIDIPGGPAAQGLSFGSLAKPADSMLDGFEYRLRTPQGTSNAALLGFASAPPVLEAEPNSEPAKAQKLTVPCEVAGQFYPRQDQDFYTFDAKKGDVYSIEVISQRMGLSTDPFLLVQQVTKNDKGEEQVKDLQVADDLAVNIGGADFNTTTDDPSYRLVIPDDGVYRVLVRDLYYGSRGDPRYLYRLSIGKEQPDFRLVALPRSPSQQGQQQSNPWAPLLRKGGTELIDVLAFRRDGFNGSISVAIEGLPPGVACSLGSIGPDMNRTTLVLKAADDAASWAGTIKVVGKAKIGEAEVTREARGGGVIWPGGQNQSAAESRMVGNLALAVSGTEVAPFVVELNQEKPWEMSRAGKLEIPIKVTRRGDFKGNVALVPVGLPKNVTVGNVTINADKADGVLTVTLAQNSPVGTYSFYLQSSTQVNYRRNPEALAAAEEVKKASDKALAEVTEANKKAVADKQAADTAATASTADAKKATDAKAAADKAVADAAAALKAAEDKAKAAKEAADKDAANKGLADAKIAADKALEEATAKSKAASEAKAAADKAAEESTAKAKVAADAKAAADKTAAEMAEKLKAADALQKAAVKRAQDADAAAKPKNINVFDPSTAVTVTITEAPITLAPTPAPGALKQGQKIEIPITVNRLYGYVDPVEFEISPPSGVSGLKISKLTIAKDQSQGKIELEADAKATPGAHTLSIKATAKFNNQNLQVSQSVPLTIEKVEAAK